MSDGDLNCVKKLEKIVRRVNKVDDKEVCISIMLGVTGSVAAIKVAELASKLVKAKSKIQIISKETSEKEEWKTVCFDVKIVPTERSLEFMDYNYLLKKTGVSGVLSDKDEWGQWKKIGDMVLHIDLRKWADICIIAPLTANTLTKIAIGLCDNLLTCIVKAWEYENKKMLVAPAMNTTMWENSHTQQYIDEIQKRFGIEIIDPVEKMLACGVKGVGALAKVDDIIRRVQLEIQESYYALKERNILKISKKQIKKQ